MARSAQDHMQTRTQIGPNRKTQIALNKDLRKDARKYGEPPVFFCVSNCHVFVVLLLFSLSYFRMFCFLAPSRWLTCPGFWKMVLFFGVSNKLGQVSRQSAKRTQSYAASYLYGRREKHCMQTAGVVCDQLLTDSWHEMSTRMLYQVSSRLRHTLTHVHRGSNGKTDHKIPG